MYFNDIKDQTKSHPQDSITKKAPGKNSIKNVTESTKSLKNKKCEEKLGSVKKLEANNNGKVNISDKSVSDDSLKAHKLTKTHKNRKIKSPTTKNNSKKNYLINQTVIQKIKELQQKLCNMSNSNKGFEVKKRNGNLSNPKESNSNKKDVTSKNYQWQLYTINIRSFAMCNTIVFGKREKKECSRNKRTLSNSRQRSLFGGVFQDIFRDCGK